MSRLAHFLLLIFIASLTACGGDSTPANNAPVANAGTDIFDAVIGTAVSLDGSLSVDDDGDVLTYNWNFSSVPANSTTDTTTALMGESVQFTPDAAGAYIISLVVDDGRATDTDEIVVVVDVVNTAPVANAGADQLNVTVATALSLDASLSADAEGDDLAYVWGIVSAPNGSVSNISNIFSANPSFTPDLEGVYRLSLVVTDGVFSHIDEMFITTSGNTAPTSVTLGSILTGDTINGFDLYAGLSIDSSGDRLSYTWSLVSAPPTSLLVAGVLNTSETSVQYNFIPDVSGNYTLSLTVSDGALSSTSEFVISALVGSSAEYVSTDVFPIIIPDNDIVTGASASLTISDGPVSIEYLRVSLDITHASEAAIDIFIESPSGTLVELSTDNTGTGNHYINTTFDDFSEVAITDGSPPFTGFFVPEQSLSTFNTEDANGIWILHVYDDDGGNDTGTLDGWQLSFPDALPPVADAGAAQTINVGNLVQLDGTTSVSNSGGTLSYLWTLEAPAGSNAVLDDATLDMPSFTADVVGIYNTTLIVSDENSSALVSVSHVATIAGIIYNSADTFPLSIPDDDLVTGVSSTINVSAASDVVSSVSVQLSIMHTYVSDLNIYLTSPTGTQIILSEGQGADGENYINTVFGGSIWPSITTGTAPFTGYYQPQESMNLFTGELATGVWTLEVIDGFVGDIGTIEDWSLIIVY